MALLSSTSYLNSQILTDLSTLITQLGTWITGNTYLSIFFTMSLIAVATGVFKALRRILRG